MKASDTALRAPVIIGRGRVGRSLAAALLAGGVHAELRGRDEATGGLEGRLVLLCVPDAAIAEVAGRIGASGESPALAGHVSGATGLEVLAAAGAEGTFSLHPLQTIPDGETDLTGCPAAIAGDREESRATASELARRAGMEPFEVAEADRATYHAAASIASNFLVTIEQTAAELLGSIAVENPREVLEPLVRRSLDNWLARGDRALTGPIVRGDEATVEAHRRALQASDPALLGFYDALATRTREIAAGRQQS